MNSNEESRELVSEYEFQPLMGKETLDDGSISSFNFKPLKKDFIRDVKKHENDIKFERKVSNQNNFKISPIVREHRGINRQEELEKQRLIQEEIESRLLQVQENAYREGLEKGMKDGRDEVFTQLRSEVDSKLERLQDMIDEVLKTQSDLIQNEKMAVYRTVKNLTKWIILRELKGDGEYILRLLEKLVSELQVKSNIFIQLDANSFSDMPEILEMIQERMGDLEKVRVECDYDIEGPGIVVESENGIINGSLKEQFQSLAKLFHNVGLIEDEEFSAQDFYDTPSINGKDNIQNNMDEVKNEDKEDE